MNEEQLNKMLHDMDVPEPDAQRKASNIDASVSVFEENSTKNQETTQGIEETRRPIDENLLIQEKIIEGWRSIMDKFFTFKPALATTAAVTLAIIAGIHFTPDEVKTPVIEPVVVAEEKGDAVLSKDEDASLIVAPKEETHITANKIDAIGEIASVKKESTEEAKRRAPMDKNMVLSDIVGTAPSASESMGAGSATQRLVKAKPMGIVAPNIQYEQEDVRIMQQPMPVPDVIASGHYQDEGRDRFEKIVANAFKLASDEPVSTFSIDVDTASYSFVRKSLNRGQLPQSKAVRVEELINYFDYHYPVADSKETPFTPTVAMYKTPWNEHTKLLHVGIQGYDIADDERPDSNLVFLLDVSGSMNAPDKLPLLKNAFRMLVDTLKADDTVSIVVYAGAAGTVLEPTKVSEKEKIFSALDRLSAGGSTAGAAGIKQAYQLAESNFLKEGVNRVILATDGDFNVGISNREELKSYIEKKRDTGVFLSVLGFGAGNYNDALMQTLAQNGNGNAAYIDTLSEARKVLVEEAGSTLFTIAKDVKIQVEFNPAKIAEYRLIGYESRILQREDFNNDKVDAGEVGAGHNVTAIYEVVEVGSDRRNIDPLRYGNDAPEKNVEKKAIAENVNEYAFLKMRYKLPDESKSTLITRPVTTEDMQTDFSEVNENVRFASAVAAFGQMLRGGEHTGDLTYDDIISLAQSAKGEDQFGRRAEFINLVRLAKSAR